MVVSALTTGFTMSAECTKCINKVNTPLIPHTSLISLIMAWINYESMRQSDTMAPTSIPGKSQEKYFLFVYYILSYFRHYNISLYCSVRSNLFALMCFYLFSTELARWQHTGGNSLHCLEMALSSLRSRGDQASRTVVNDDVKDRPGQMSNIRGCFQ